MKTRYSFFILLAIFLKAGPTTFAQSVLERYIRQGIDSNVALKQQEFDLDRAKLDLERARTLFYPQVQLNAQYFLATGGRTIDVPIGDLLNNVYTSLNQLTSSSKFPQVQNQHIKFLPNDYNDTRIEVNVPIYNPSLSLNKKIKEELIGTQQERLNQYKRELVFNIKQAYYQYLQSQQAVAIYNNALATVNENLRLNEKLVKNQAATKEVVLKARAQVSKVQTSLAQAEGQQKNAAAYLNFLLNQSLETPVEIDSSIYQTLQQELPVPTGVPEQREELKQLKSTQTVLQTSLKLTQTYRLPSLSGFYNIGYQGYGYKFSSTEFYQLGGLQLQWNIFHGNDNKLKAKQAAIDLDALRSQYDNASKQVLLQATTAYNEYRSALAALHSASDEVASTAEAFRLTNSRYLQGGALQIELIDARTQMTNAEISYSLAQLAVLNKSAELERALAMYPIK